MIKFFLIFIMLLLFIIALSQDKGFHYENYAMAVTGDLSKDHWIPEIIPPSAKDIYMQSHYDPGFLYIYFSYDEKDQEVVTQGFTKLTHPFSQQEVLNIFKEYKWPILYQNPITIYAYLEKKNYNFGEINRYLLVNYTIHKVWFLGVW